MRIPKFEYFCPSSIEEVVPALQTQDRGKICRGTDLFVKMKKKRFSLRCHQSERNSEIRQDRWDDREGLRIGPLVTHEALVNHPIVREKFDFLSEACFKIGTRQVRNMELWWQPLQCLPFLRRIGSLLVLETKVKLVHLYGERLSISKNFSSAFPNHSRSPRDRGRGSIPKPLLLPSALINTFIKPLCRRNAGRSRCVSRDGSKDSSCREARIGLSLLLQPLSGQRLRKEH